MYCQVDETRDGWQDGQQQRPASCRAIMPSHLHCRMKLCTHDVELSCKQVLQSMPFRFMKEDSVSALQTCAIAVICRECGKMFLSCVKYNAGMFAVSAHDQEQLCATVITAKSSSDSTCQVSWKLSPWSCTACLCTRSICCMRGAVSWSNKAAG